MVEHKAEEEEGESSEVVDSLDWHESVCVDLNGGYGRKPDLGNL